MKIFYTAILCLFFGTFFSAQLLLNGNFIHSASSSLNGWTSSGDFNFNTTFSQWNFDIGYGYTSGIANASGSLYQTVSIPAVTSSATLSLYYKISTNETNFSVPYDVCTIKITEVGSSSNTHTFTTLSHIDRNTVYQQLSYSIPSSFFGKNVTVMFQNSNDAAKSTTFRFDNISLNTTTSSGGGGLITRGAFSFLLFNKLYGLYGSTTNINNYAASKFPNPFADMQQPSSYQKYVTLFSYFERGDGIPVFDRSKLFFNENLYFTREEVVRIIMEAYGQAPAISGTEPYIDYSLSANTIDHYWYIVEAYRIGILPTSSTLNPSAFATTTFVTNLMNSIGVAVYTPPGILSNIQTYFIPQNISPGTFGKSLGIEQGVFSHYAKNSFVVPDIKMNLNFSHSYSNFMVEMPSEIYKVKPLSRGWSHTYNSYIIREDNVGPSSIDYYYIIWPDGSIQVYDEDANQYDTKGVYDDFNDHSSMEIRITKKDQTEYRYKKLNSSRKIYYLEKIIDRNGNEIEIVYENALESNTKRIKYVYAPSRKRLEFTYISAHDLIDEILDPIGRDIEFEYSGTSSGWYYKSPVLVKFDDAKGNNTIYSYKAINNYSAYLLNRIELPRGNIVKAQYDVNGKLSEYKINDNNPVAIDVDYDYVNGIFESEVETALPSGNLYTKEYEFNENGLITDYDDNNNSLSINYPSSGPDITLPSNSSLNGLDVDYTYDNNGNIEEVDIENGDVVHEYDYNLDNTLNWYKDPNGNKTYYDYDANGNLDEIEDPFGEKIIITNNNLGQVTSVENQTGIITNYTYESDGALSTITEPMGYFQHFTHDGINRLISTNNNGLIDSIFYDPNDNIIKQINTGGLMTSFDYDANDNLVQIVNANGHAIDFKYDSLDRLEEEKFGPLVKEYRYNSKGQMDRVEKPSGTKVYYDYDSDGRLEEAGTITDIDYNSNDLMSEITTNAGNTNLYYNNLNRLDKVKTVHNTEVEYTYDDAGNITYIDYPTHNGTTFYVRYNYDAKNRMTKLRIYINGNSTTIADYYYRKDDKLMSTIYGNGIKTDYTYDSLGRKQQLTHWLNSTSPQLLYNHFLTTDKRGNVTKEEDYYRQSIFLPPSGRQPETRTYSYDSNNHINSLNGNPVINVNNDGNTTFIRDSSSYTFQNYNYDIDDKLISITDSNYRCSPFEFKYNGFGQQTSVKKQESGSPAEYKYYTWDILNENIIYETVNNFAPIYHVYGATGLEITVVNTDTASKPKYIQYLGDLQGNVVCRTQNDTSYRTLFFKYDDFGNEITGAAGHHNTGCFYRGRDPLYRFLGKYGVKSETGANLYNVKARYYDANLGRFLNEDPIWSTNLYPYSNNNPISYIDPSGKSALSFDATTIGVSASAIALGGFNVSLNANFIEKGKNASRCPIITGSFGLGAGISIGLNAKIGGYNYSGSEDFQASFLNSSGFYNYNSEFEYPGFNVGVNYERDKTGSNNETISGYFITGGLGGGALSVNKNATFTILNTNKINDYFKMDFCKRR